MDDAALDGPTPRRTILWITVLTMLVAAVALCIDRARSGDLYLELSSGRFIAEHGLVGYDPFPTIEQGRPWLNEQWLSELGFYSAARSIGITGITVLYAFLISAPLGIVLAAIRRKGPMMMFAAAALYLPGLFAIIHPRAAGFTLLAFTALMAFVLAAWRLPSPGAAGLRGLRWAVVAIPLLFALWANLHGGFLAGLLLIGLATTGLALDRWRGLAGAIASNRLALLALTGVLGAAAVTVATPLGVGAIWAYVASFLNPALSIASTEWEPATQSVAATIYVAIAAAFSAWLWWRSPRPRRVMPPLVAAGFVLFAASSIRNIVFIAPALAVQIACSAPDRRARPPRAALAVIGAAIVAAGATYVVLGPPRNDRVGSPVVQYALRHPPARGRIAAFAGPSSYILWRSPHTPVVIDGWLEHFKPAELRGNFALLDGRSRGVGRDIRRLDVGAVIAPAGGATAGLERYGFIARYRGPGGVYLVRARGGRLPPRHRP